MARSVMRFSHIVHRIYDGTHSDMFEEEEYKDDESSEDMDSPESTDEHVVTAACYWNATNNSNNIVEEEGRGEDEQANERPVTVIAKPHQEGLRSSIPQHQPKQTLVKVTNGNEKHQANADNESGSFYLSPQDIDDAKIKQEIFDHGIIQRSGSKQQQQERQQQERRQQEQQKSGEQTQREQDKQDTIETPKPEPQPQPQYQDQQQQQDVTARLSSLSFPQSDSNGDVEHQHQHPEDQLHNSEKKTRTKFLFVLSSLFFIIALIGVILVFVLVRGRDNKNGAGAISDDQFDEKMGLLKELVASAHLNSNGTTTISNNPKSPQSKALQWLVKDDPLQLIDEILMFGQDDYVRDEMKGEDRVLLETTTVERYALMVIYFSTTTENTEAIKKQQKQHGGTSQTNKWKNWCSELSICDWDEGIECNHDTSTHDGFVSKINLSGYSLSGTIPKELSLFKHLQELVLGYNSLTGTIPTEICDVSSLESLDLGSNGLTGTIPTNINRLSHLSALRLWDNQLTGTIPSTIGEVNKLQHFDVFRNQLTGSIPSEVRNLVELRSFLIAANAVSGNINSVFCKHSDYDDEEVNGNGKSRNYDALDVEQFPKLFKVFADCGGQPPDVTCECCQCRN